MFEQYNIVFVVFEKSRGWILEAICCEIATYCKAKFCYHYTRKNLPSAKTYFYAHYYFFSECIKHKPELLKKRNLIWFTHIREDLDVNIQEIIQVVNSNKKCIILVPCSHNRDILIAKGLKQNRIRLVLGAADPLLFSRISNRKHITIGFCTAYYERKRPDRIFGLIEMFPQYKFILLGKGWRESPYWEQINKSKNLEYVEAAYEQYPEYYEKMDVFVSTSDLEGGPIPLIEAMMSNVIPVACDTGFARDLIQHSVNGYIFTKEAELEEIGSLIEIAFLNDSNIRSTVEKYTWKYFSEQVMS
jgi:glycosyltransferase involved in cell wall biosynthesis